MYTPIPHLSGWPVFGSLAAFRTRRLALFEQVRQACGPIGSFSLGPRSLVMLADPALIQRVFVDHAADVRRPDRLRDLLLPAIGTGLLNSDGALHRRQRRLIAPSLQSGHIVAYATSMTDAAMQLQQTWRDGAEIALDQEMLRLTLRIIGQTLFGVDVLTDAPTVAAALATMNACVNAAVGALIPVPTAWPTPQNRRYRRAVARLDTIIYRIIAARRQAGDDPDDFLGRLLQAQDADDGSFMTPRQVRDEAMTFFTAGHETTANTLSWAWYLLLQHPEAYARLRAEVDQVLGQRPPTLADLPQLPYTLQIFKEALRLYRGH